MKIGLVQINNSFSGQNYLPYSVACLQSYAQHKLKDNRYQFLPLVYKRAPINTIVSNLIAADIVGFSVYVWNFQISLEIARRLKEIKSNILIVFGGPHVPDGAESFLRQNHFIDLAVHNEGEEVFYQILKKGSFQDWSNIPNISFIAPDNSFVRTAFGGRLRELDEIPSPFLNGVFDSLMKNNPQEEWIGLWETNRGCPFQCTFCDWGSATTSKVNKFGLDRLKNEIDWFVKKRIKYIFVCDANFGIQKRDVEIAKHVSRVRLETGYPHGFSVQNTKNATERAYESQKILSDAGLNKGVALSMQSLDSLTLKNIKRDNISLNTYFELARRFTEDAIETYTDLILALPGETYDSFTNGVNTLILAGQHNRIQFNNLSILPNSEMADTTYRKFHQIETIKSEIINIHGTRELIEDDVPEFQDLVIATKSMPREEWCRVRVFAWMSSFLYFDKICQYPLILLNKISGISHRNIIEAFLDPPKDCIILNEIISLFDKEAVSIQQGGAEYIYSKEWLGIYWPADEFVFIKLTTERKLDRFYYEVSVVLNGLIKNNYYELVRPLEDAIKLNRSLISQPFVHEDTILNINYNILEFCEAVKRGKEVELRKMPVALHVKKSLKSYAFLDDWCREVVWWGNKKGAYLNKSENIIVEPQLAGHY